MEFEFDSPPNSPDPSLDKSTATRSRSSLHTSFSSPSTVVSSRGKQELSVQVRGAGTSTSELQDAGSFQMIQDECQYHCSAILSSRTPTQMMDATVDLITLLSNRKNRKILWQSLSSDTTDDPLKVTTTVSPLISILDVIATQFVPSTLTSPRSTSSVLSDAASVSSTIIPKGGLRTKSARRKLKQQQQGQPTPTSTASSAVAVHDVSSSPELRQLMAILVTLLSWDCTISKPHSVAAMDVEPRPQLAQQVRLAILQHPSALQAILRSSCKNANSLTGESTAPASTHLLSPPPSAIASQSQTDSVVSSTHSVSSISHDGSQSTAATNNEDPTKVGRRNRRRRRLEQIQQQQQSQGPLMPVQESYTPLEDSLEFGSMPPPAKRQQTQPPPSATSTPHTSLSFSSDVAPGRTTTVDPFLASQSVQTSSHSARRLKKLQAVRSRLWPKQKVQCTCSNCCPPSTPLNASTTTASNLWVSLALWQAVHRIVSGKEGDEPSCLEPLDDEEDDEENPVEQDEPNNPILVTNQLLDKASVIPLLSQCMSETLERLQESSEERNRSPKDMTLCQQWKLEGLDHLASLMDGACLLHPTNRRSFVEYDPFSFEIQRKEQGLMYQILAFLWGVLQQKSAYSLDSHPLLLALRTLTSLSHDNPVAAEQVLESYQFGLQKGKRASMRGLEVLAKLLFLLVSKPQKCNDDFQTTTDSITDTTDDPTHRYDSTNFCLNTITNIIESSDARKVLSECTVQTPSGRKSWLVWLCHWQTKQTEGFRDAIMSIGKSNPDARHSKRELQKSEEEKLIIAGNGCIVLACLMMDHKSGEEPELTDQLRETILNELAVAGTTKSAAFDLMINTLKAFCNFYHFSLGELSVAVIAPVKKLMDQLLELQKDIN